MKFMLFVLPTNDRTFLASRSGRGSRVARRECIELTVEGDRGFESISLHQ